MRGNPIHQPAKDPFFEELARLAVAEPQRTAFELVHGPSETLLTRGGLLERVRVLGEAFRAAGYGSGSKVALLLENRPAWAVAHFAAWYAGAAVVPLDPQLEASGLGLLLEHSEATLLVTSDRHLAKAEAALKGRAEPPVILDVDVDPDRVWDGGENLGAASAAGAANAPRSILAFVAAHPEARTAWDPVDAPADLGLLIYTSGTTGDPKGVMQARDSVMTNLEAVASRVDFNERDSILGVLPLFHVLPLLANCVAPAFFGSRAVYLDELGAESILDAFRERRITLFACVPLFFDRFHARVRSGIAKLPPLRRRIARMLIALCRIARRRFGWRLGRHLLGVVHRPFGSDMRLMLTGGAKINKEIYADLLDWGLPVSQGYGLTEATAGLTIAALSEVREDSVGRALDGVELQVRDKNADGIGEIWAKSPSLMRGYFKNPEATDKMLVDGWLCTGDLGKIDEAGNVSITGRAKDIIVLASGKNVYPEELEQLYGQSEFISELCFIGREDPERRGAERLHAVVVPDVDEARRQGYVNVREMVLWELEEHGKRLASWQRPTGVTFRNDPLPRTTSRKVRRFEVKHEVEAEFAREAAAPEIAAVPDPEPATEQEQALLDLIARDAGRPYVRRQDHLDLDLGFDSLDRVELVAAAASLVGTRAEPEIIGAAHTVGDLLDALARAPAVGAGGELQSEDEYWRRALSEAPQEFVQYLKRGAVHDGAARLGSFFVRNVLRLTGGLRVTGLENLPKSGPYLICPNHTSYLDVAIHAAAVPRKLASRLFYVGYAEYFNSAFGRAFSRLWRNIPVDQNLNMERSLQAAAEGLRRGMVLVIFPEGGRSLPDQDVLPFRRGPAILARQLDVPLVPVGIWGAHRLWGRGTRPRRHPVAVAIGSPVDPVSPGMPADTGELGETLRDRVVGLVDEAKRLYHR
ncbi:MAG: AMP-binding protein [bacterium]|nr:AMP-binding protein [bacterium]